MAAGEKKIMDEVALAWSERGLGRLFRANVGVYQTRDGRMIRIGVPGFSDLHGFTMLDGNPVATYFEVKTGRLTATHQQIAFLNSMKEHGCLAGVIRSLADALELKNLWGGR